MLPETLRTLTDFIATNGIAVFDLNVLTETATAFTYLTDILN
jgi:hypothetical protein